MLLAIPLKLFALVSELFLIFGSLPQGIGAILLALLGIALLVSLPLLGLLAGLVAQLLDQAASQFQVVGRVGPVAINPQGIRVSPRGSRQVINRLPGVRLGHFLGLAVECIAQAVQPCRLDVRQASLKALVDSGQISFGGIGKLTATV